MIDLFVMDTSALISAHLSPQSVNREAYDLACNKGVLAFSKATFHEFALTFTKEKFERYQSLEERLKMISLAEQRGQLFEVSIKLKVCRDPTDDMFLELAMTSEASAIITRDPDLLVLHPFEQIPILSPSDFLKMF
jgi:uncharacterized protein